MKKTPHVPNDRSRIKAHLEQDEFARATLQNSHSCILVLDTQGRVLMMSANGMRLMEMNAADLRGKKWPDLWPQEARQTILSTISTVKKGTAQYFQGFCPTFKGTPKWWNVFVTPIPDHQGNIVRLFVDACDITVLKEVEKELCETKTYAGSIIATFQEPLLILTSDFHIKFANSAFYENFGFNMQETEGKLIYEMDNRQWDIPALRTMLEVMLPKCPVKNFEIDHHFEQAGRRVILFNAHRLDNSRFILLGVRDITASKKMEETLRDNERWLAAILEQLPVSVGVMNNSGQFILSNSSMRYYVGENAPSRDPKAIERWSCLDAQGQPIPQDQWPSNRALRGEIISPGMEFIYKDANGEKLWMTISTAPLRGTNQEIMGAIAVIQDITKRKRVEEMLEHERDLLQAVMDGAKNTHLVALDRNFNFLRVNETYAATCGYRSDEMVGKNFFDLFPHRENEEIFTRVRDTGVSFEFHDKPFEFPGKPERGVTFWDWMLVPIKDDTGNVLGLIFSLHETTERKRTEMALRASERRLQKMINIDGVSVLIFDERGILIDANDTFLRISGYSRQDLEGKMLTWQSMTPPEYMEITRQQMRKLEKTGRIGPYEKELLRKDGSRSWMLFAGATLGDGSMVGYCIDISPRKIAEKNLRESETRYRLLNEKLELLVRERTAKLEDQAWRLRLLAKELTETQQRERDSLAEILHDHVQQFIIASKIRLDMLEKKQPDLHEDLEKATGFIEQALKTCRSLSAELRPPALYESGLGPALRFLARKMKEQYDFTVNMDIDQDISLDDHFMKTMLYQSVRELFLNAVKHAKVKECFLSMRLGKEGELRIRIWDHGVGFNTASMSTETLTFGLFSIQERIRAIGGDFQIQSEMGKGSSFELIMPRQLVYGNGSQKKKEWEPKMETVPLIGNSAAETLEKKIVRLLLVDDHRIVREGLRHLLNDNKFIQVVCEAEDGEEAVEKAMELRPDVILMDINMPKMNGIEATRVICNRLPAKVIGLSVQGEKETIEAMTKAGAVSFFHKDGNTTELIDTIRGFSQSS